MGQNWKRTTHTLDLTVTRGDVPYSVDLVQFLELQRSSSPYVTIWFRVHHCYPFLGGEISYSIDCFSTIDTHHSAWRTFPSPTSVARGESEGESFNSGVNGLSTLHWELPWRPLCRGRSLLPAADPRTADFPPPSFEADPVEQQTPLWGSLFLIDHSLLTIFPILVSRSGSQIMRTLSATPTALRAARKLQSWKPSIS